ELRREPGRGQLTLEGRDQLVLALLVAKQDRAWCDVKAQIDRRMIRYRLDRLHRDLQGWAILRSGQRRQGQAVDPSEAQRQAHVWRERSGLDGNHEDAGFDGDR